ncbi:hypothetical protein QBC38DRAFT_474424 [Podospora fimiseda]|uniref:LITAF domain-containing protein n=1 Tax=Podospora fimiseda TaxID=252190 RepID=A0AAN7BSC1_9PEZI|nr:hypothetical protein QBC38DRAFT_474424 [Podospora fimiseda]
MSQPQDINAAATTASAPPPAYTPNEKPLPETTPQQQDVSPAAASTSAASPAPVQVPQQAHITSEQPKPLPVLPGNPTQQNMLPVEASIATPLNMLSDQPQWIDCPFCQRRTKTRVQKEGTPMQIIAGALCCLFCICLTCVPCIAGWFEEIHYFCSGCNNKVAMRPDSGPLQIYAPGGVVVQQAVVHAVVPGPVPVQKSS